MMEKQTVPFVAVLGLCAAAVALLGAGAAVNRRRTLVPA